MSGRRNRYRRHGKSGRRNPVIAVLTTAAIIALYAYFGPTQTGESTAESERGVAVSGGASGGALYDAIRKERSGVLVQITARVIKNLPDDNDGSRHQRILIELEKPVGDVRTILIAHNIDLAPRVPCKEGDVVTVNGQYEWNDKGGVIHWTHIDPGGRRDGGWIEHKGERYE